MESPYYQTDFPPTPRTRYKTAPPKLSLIGGAVAYIARVLGEDGAKKTITR